MPEIRHIMALSLNVENAGDGVSVGFDLPERASYCHVTVGDDEGEIHFQMQLSEAVALRRLLDLVIATIPTNDNGKA